jgi:hypothetical protein
MERSLLSKIRAWPADFSIVDAAAYRSIPSASSIAIRIARKTNVFVAKYVSFKLKLDLLDGFATFVGDVHINVDACAANPNLTMQSSSQSNHLNGSLTRFDPLI